MRAQAPNRRCFLSLCERVLAGLAGSRIPVFVRFDDLCRDYRNTASQKAKPSSVTSRTGTVNTMPVLK
jgi:hypothetical protein